LHPAAPKKAAGANFPIQMLALGSTQEIVVDCNLAAAHYCANLLATPASRP